MQLAFYDSDEWATQSSRGPIRTLALGGDRAMADTEHLHSRGSDVLPPYDETETSLTKENRMDDSTPQNGQCMCGAVRYRATIKGSFATCYCKMCQRWSSGAFMGAPTTHFEVTEGGESLTVFKSSDWAERAFCSKCGSNIYYFSPKYGNNKTVALGTLDNPNPLTINNQYFIDKKPAGFSLREQCKNLTSAEIEAMFSSE